MKDKKIFVGLIPAKKKSTGLKDKNFKKINGISLFIRAVNSSIKSKNINSTFVTSDSKKILSDSLKKRSNIIKRPYKLCLKKTEANEVVSHAAKYIAKKFDVNRIIIVYLQPTSPLRTFKHVDQSINLFIKKNAKSLISVCEADKSIHKSLILDKQRLKSVFDKKLVTTNRQDLPKIYMPNGAIFIFYLKDFLKTKKIPIENSFPYFMTKKESIDIDNSMDLEYANFLSKRKLI